MKPGPTSVEMGSIGGGGRYDDLTGLFGWPGVAGIGISFGLDRIYDVMDELNLFPNKEAQGPQVLITRMDEEGYLPSLNLLKKLREEAITAELYPEITKMKKQLNYADKKGFSFTLFIGPEERAAQRVGLKNMHTGKQSDIDQDELIQWLKNNLITA